MTAAFKASSTWVVAAAFLLALSSIAGVTILHRRATTSRDAQVGLEEVQREFDALQNIAYDGIGAQPAARAVILRRIQTIERRIEAALAALRRDESSPHLEAVMAPYRANTATLERIRVAIARGQEHRADLLGPVAGRSQRAVDRALGRARVTYQQRTSESLRLAAAGSAAMILALVTLFAVFYVRLGKANATAEQLAVTDELTGLPNRRAWYQQLDFALARAGRSRQPITVLILDLDGFKHVNDREGHPAGDRLLKSVSSCWSSALRTTDLLGRIGGDEFAVILELTDEAAALEVVARLDQSLSGRHRASVGVAVWDGHEDASTVVTRADADMYEHKKRAYASAELVAPRTTQRG